MAGRQHFLAGLGAALLKASDVSRMGRAEDFEKAQAKQRQDMELARMALSREQFDLDKKGFEAGQQRDARGFAKDVLETAGPNGVLDAAGSAAVEAGGFGFRLGPSQDGTLDSKPFVMDTINTTPEGLPGVMQTTSPGLAPGRQVMPTADQAFQLEQQGKARNIEETRRRAQAAVSQPGFYKMPEINRAVVWQQAGFDGNPPMSIEEWQGRQQFQAGLQQNNAVALENLRHANDMREIPLRGMNTAGGAKGNKMPLGMINELTMMRDAIGQTAPGSDLAAAVGKDGNTGWLPGLQAQAPAGVADLLGLSANPRNRQAMIALAKQIIGKGLEGGVLRKEDEAKYADILPTMSDPTEVAVQKVKHLNSRIQSKLDVYTDTISRAGYDTSNLDWTTQSLAGTDASGMVTPGNAQAGASGQVRIIGRRPAGGGQ